MRTPFLPAGLSKEDQMKFLRLHFLDQIDFQDTMLLYSNAWANKAIAYLSLYGNSKISQKELEGEFIKAVTVMLGAASVNADIYKFLLDYFVGGFDKYHFDGVITYMADHFQDPFCRRNWRTLRRSLSGRQLRISRFLTITENR